MAELWYYTRDGQAQDPVPKGELAQLAGAGLLNPTDLVWTEGMPQWVRASSAPGIFAEDALTAPGRSPAGESRRSAVYDLEGPRPSVEDDLETRAETRRSRNRRRDENDDWTDRNEEDDYDRRRRRKQGLSAGAKAGIIAVVLVAVLVVVGVVLLIALNRGGGGSNTRSFSLAAPQQNGGRVATPKQDFQIPFKGGNKVEIWVKSTGQSDIDLYVYDAANRRVEFDDGDSSDCYVRFRAVKSQNYRVELRNEFRPDQQWRNGANSGTLTFKEGPPAAGEVLVEYTTRLPWFENPANQRPGFNPGFGGPPFNPPGLQPPGGFKGPGIRPPINRPRFPNNPNVRP
jgi:hypothetical protein